MKFLLLLYGDESQWADATPEEISKMMEDYQAYDGEIQGAGVYVGGEALEPSSAATTVRVRDGEPVLSDGPFAETREQLGGFYLLDCADLDEALRWASKLPAALDGSVEVRPVLNYETYGFEHPDAQQAQS
jgi:hypothetical protein